MKYTNPDVHPPVHYNPAGSDLLTGSIPAELRALKQWVLWRYRWDEKREAWSKMPCSAYTGKAAAVTKPENFATYEIAAKACATFKASGVGFVFTPNDPYCGVDLDNAVKRDPNTGEMVLTDFAKRTIASLPPTYTELSISDTGLHLIFKADWGGGNNSQALGLEVYDRGRYFTVSGSVYAGYEIAEADLSSLRVHFDKAITAAPTGSIADDVLGGISSFREQIKASQSKAAQPKTPAPVPAVPSEPGTLAAPEVRQWVPAVADPIIVKGPLDTPDQPVANKNATWDEKRQIWKINVLCPLCGKYDHQTNDLPVIEQGGHCKCNICNGEYEFGVSPRKREPLTPEAPLPKVSLATLTGILNAPLPVAQPEPVIVEAPASVPAPLTIFSNAPVSIPAVPTLKAADYASGQTVSGSSGIATIVEETDYYLNILSTLPNGVDVIALFNGDTNACGCGGDNSKADYVLAAHLAFFCQDSPDRLVRLMYSSGLRRDKWDDHRIRHSSTGDSYFTKIISDALARTGSFYDGPEYEAYMSASEHAERKAAERAAAKLSAMQSHQVAVAAGTGWVVPPPPMAVTTAPVNGHVAVAPVALNGLPPLPTPTLVNHPAAFSTEPAVAIARYSLEDMTVEDELLQVPEVKPLTLDNMDFLPDWLGGYLTELAEDTEVAPEMVLTYAFGILASICGRGTKIHNGKFDQFMNLYTLVCAESGARKSPPFNAMVKPLFEWEMAMNETRAKARAIDIQERKEAKVQLKQLERDMKNAVDDQVRGDIRELMKPLNARLAEKPIRDIQIIMDDATTPAIFSAMEQADDGAMALMSSESSIFDALSGAGRDGYTRDTIALNAYDGAQLTLNRKGSNDPNAPEGNGPRRIGRALLTIVNAVQTSKLYSIVNKNRQGTTESGFLMRFLYVIPRHVRASRLYASDAIKPKYDQFSGMIKKLMNMSMVAGTLPQDLFFDAAASRRFNHWRLEYEQVFTAKGEAGVEGDLAYDVNNPDGEEKGDNAQKWCSKHPARITRLAGIMHIVKHMNDAMGIPVYISDETVKVAMELGVMYHSHAMKIMGGLDYNAMHGRSGAPIPTVVLKTADEVLAVLQDWCEKGICEFSVRDIQKRFPRRMPTAKLANEILSMLVERNFIKALGIPKGSKTMRYQVSPLAMSKKERIFKR